MNDKKIILVGETLTTGTLTIRALKKNNVLNPSPWQATAPRPPACFSGTTTATRTARRSSCST
jgi:hypothetical protein